MDEPEFDVFVTGTVFLDIIFTGMGRAPAGGHEVWTDGMGSSPGGVANLAVAASRLGLRTSLASAFGDDIYGEYCWHVLAELEGVDLTPARQFRNWHSPVTVSLAYDDDRAMVTHAHPPPVGPTELIIDPPRTRLAYADMAAERAPWLDRALERGVRVFADVGWDETEVWDTDTLIERLRGCYAFVPNAGEAMGFTRTNSPGAALEVIRDWVPLAVVTAGTGGAFAADGETGETAWVPSLTVPAMDPTGAGDVFLAGLMLGTLRGLSLTHRLRFAGLCAALSVQQFGGALAAPGWADLAAWWTEAKGTVRYARDFAFLPELIPPGADRKVRRAMATIGLGELLGSEEDDHDHDSVNPS
jgi:sugar/nucleoside kinase (ribokinase family)